MKKIILLCFVLLVLIGCSQPKQQQTTPTPITPTPETKVETKTQVTEPTSNVPSNWKTYQGDVKDHKFEIKHPPEFEMVVEKAEFEIDNNIFFLNNDRGVMVIGLNPISSELYTKDILINVLRKSNKLRVISEKNITTNGHTITYFVAEVPGVKPPKQNQIYYAYITTNDNRLTFQISGPDLETTLTLDQFLQILSTFRFLN